MIYKLNQKERHNSIRHAITCTHIIGRNVYIYHAYSKRILTSVSCKPMATSFSISGKDCTNLLVRSCSASLAELICAPWCMIMWCALCRVCSSSFLQLLRCSLKWQMKHYWKHPNMTGKMFICRVISQIFHYCYVFMHTESQPSLQLPVTLLDKLYRGIPIFFQPCIQSCSFWRVIEITRYHIHTKNLIAYVLKFAFFTKIRRNRITWIPRLPAYLSVNGDVDYLKHPCLFTLWGVGQKAKINHRSAHLICLVWDPKWA